MIQWQKSRGKLYIVDFALKNIKCGSGAPGAAKCAADGKAGGVPPKKQRRRQPARIFTTEQAAPVSRQRAQLRQCSRPLPVCRRPVGRKTKPKKPCTPRKGDARWCRMCFGPPNRAQPRAGRGRIRDAGNRFYRFSFFSASIGLSVLIFRMAYIMVANTTRNTLSAAMPIAVHGSRKSVW